MSKVSVIIPAYNKAELTAKAVESVLDQTYRDIEIIVIDDGSTDNTREVMARYGDRIRYVYKDNGGACSARNDGIQLAQGEYIAFMDCDDMYELNKIELSVQYLQSHPEFGFIHTAAYFIDENDQVLKVYSHCNSRHQGWISKRIIFGNYICNSTAVVRRSCFDTVGLFDESIFAPADWDLWVRLAEQYRVGFINVPLTKYRVSDNYIFNRLDLAQKEELTVVRNYFGRNPSLAKGFKNRILSNLHLRFCGCYFVKGDHERMHNEFKQAVVLCPWNLKVFGIFIVYTFARSSLRKYLRSKILRYENKAAKTIHKKNIFIQQQA